MDHGWQRPDSEFAKRHAESSEALPAPGDCAAESIVGLTESGISVESLPPGAGAYTIYEAMTDAIEQVSGDPFPDPMVGEHEIEYWIWTGTRLVPAPPEVAERIREHEAQEQAEWHQLQERRQSRRGRSWQSYRRYATHLILRYLRGK